MTTPDTATPDITAASEAATPRRPLRARDPKLMGVRLAVVGVIAVAGPLAPPGLRTTLLITLIYGLFAMAYDIVLGYSDQPSLGHGLFFGLGTYAFLLPVADHSWGLLAALGSSLVVGAVASGLLGLAAVRLTEAFHVIITALFASIGYLLANSLTPVTGGSGGRTVDVPPLDLGMVEVSMYSRLGTYGLVAGTVIIAYLLLDRIVRSPVGQIWVAIRENPQRAANIGINVYRYKLLAFVLSGAITALAGALYAVTLRFASAEFFSFIWSVLPFVWVLIGGAGTLIGALIGAAIFAAFQFYVADLWTNYLIILGVALLIMLRYSPKGLVGTWRTYRGNLSRASEEEL